MIPDRIPPGELELLRILWAKGPSDLKTVLDVLADSGRKVAMSTIATKLRRMEDKGLVASVDDRRPKIYQALIEQDATAQDMIKDVVKSVFGGSASRMLLHLIRRSTLTPAERKGVRDELDKMT